MERVRCAPNSGQANHRFAVPVDQAAPPCRDQSSKRTGPDRSPAALTSAAPANAVSNQRNHGSRVASTGVLQHNPPESGHCGTESASPLRVQLRKLPGSSIGKSPGFCPLRILTTKLAARRWFSVMRSGSFYQLFFLAMAIVRIKLDRQVEVLNGAVNLADLVVSTAGLVRIKLDRLVVVLDGAIILALGEVGVAAIADGF